ncbi:MAG: ABC transporter permease [Acidimicrobiales bacterium]|nr:ABC transporter permease [Acidimicrobiales bacterium]HRW36302.1 ABC transporter permease [Aquihabitans sp.]
MTDILVLGLVSAAIYAVAASGLVVTYTTSGIFNFAHGAVAMVSAFVYWQLSSPDAWGLPVPLALVLTLLVFAPGLGWLIDVVLMRRLHDAAPITRLVVPIGLLVALIQGATVIWPPDTVQASLPYFFEGSTVEVAGVVIRYHQLIVFATAIVVAVALRLLLYRSRTGTAMRAVVDNRGLAALNGASPDRISSLSWALGCTLAGIAGVLIAPILALDQNQLTLLVINAYAAAMVGRLRSLPLTALGALILGIAREAVNSYQDDLPSWISVDTVPALMLFAVLILVPQDKASVFGEPKDPARVPDPSWRTVLLSSAALVAAAAVLPELISAKALTSVGYGLALGIVALSLIPLTGYAGQISLAPLAFAGIGAGVMATWGSDGNPAVLLLVVAVCAVVGALVSLPALRLKGLYLALLTFAFALFCEKAIFPEIDGFTQGVAPIDRLHLGGISFEGDRANLILMAVTFSLLGMVVTALRKGPMGRRLQAMKDSPAACATLGLDLTFLKVQVFALSAAIAGIGGVLYGGWRGQVGTEQFALLQGALPGLPLVLLTVVGGIAAVAGALFGGVVLAVSPLIGEYYPALQDLMTLLPGLAGIGLANNPNGAIAQTVEGLKKARRRAEVGSHAPATTFQRAMDLLLPAPRPLSPEQLVTSGATTATDLAVLDGELGLDWGRCRVDPRDA